MPIPTDFSAWKLISVGGFSKVFRATVKSTGEYVALKVIRKPDKLDDPLYLECEKTQIYTERNILQSNHPFILNMLGCFQNRRYLFFVLQYIPGGDLRDRLSNCGGRKFSESCARYYSAEIVSAIGYMHCHGIIYRDLKLENVLIDEKGHVKLIDFGLSIVKLGQSEGELRGTSEYLAPEMVKEQKYGEEIDWWALGIVLHEMLYGRMPFNNNDFFPLTKQITQVEVRLGKTPHVSQCACDLICALLHKIPRKRLGFGFHGSGTKSVKTHSFFGEIDFNLLELKVLPPPTAFDVHLALNMSKLGTTVQDVAIDQEIMDGEKPEGEVADMFFDFSCEILDH